MLLFTLTASAGTEAVTADGKAVILNDDGTWVLKPTEAAPVEAVEVSSDCSVLTKTETDRMTGRTTTHMMKALMLSDDGNDGLAIDVLRASNVTIWSTRAFGASACVDDTSKVNILFRDGTRLEMENDISFNCEHDLATFYGGIFGKKSQYEQLSTKEIDMLRVWTHEGFVERTLSAEQATLLRNSFACLSPQVEV